MNMPVGTTFVIDAGSFTGALPASCEVTNGAALTATASGAAVIFQAGYNMPSGSTLTMTGGSLMIADSTIAGTLTTSGTALTITASINITGSMTFNSTSAVSIPSLSISGAATFATDTTAAALTLANGATLAFVSGKFLTATTSATLTGTQTLSGTGYFALPSGVSTSGTTQASGADVRVCEYGAGVTALTATTNDDLSVSATVTKTTAARTVLTEAYINGAWTLLNAKAEGTSFTSAQATQVRVFDGAQFTTASVTSSYQATHYYKASNSTWYSDAAQTTVAGAITSSSVLYVHENATLSGVSTAAKIYVVGTADVNVGALTAEAVIGNNAHITTSGNITIVDFTGTPTQLLARVTPVAPARLRAKNCTIAE